DKAVGAGIVQFDEKSRAGNAGDVAAELCADLIGQKVGQQPVEGFALRFHGAPLCRRDGGSDFPECADISVLGQTVRAHAQGSNEAAMNYEICIAANGRGEMGIAPKVETEMTVILCGVFSLRLGPEHNLVDELFNIAPLHPVEDAVELLGMQRASFRQGDVER